MRAAQVAVTTRALRTDLTTVARAKMLMEISGSSADTLLAALIPAASAACVSFTRRPFAREVYSERLSGYDALRMMVSRTPIVNVSSVTLDGSAVTDYEIEDRDAGLLWRKQGFEQSNGFGGLFLGTPLPDAEDMNYTVAYTAGYLLPGDDVLNVASTAITVTTSDSRLVLSSGTWPLLSSGDVVETTGFIAANNGRFTVASRTSSALTFVEALTADTSTSAKSIEVTTLPRDIEFASVEAVKAAYHARSRDQFLESKTVDDLTITYRAGWGLTAKQWLPFEAQALLGPWVRG